MTLACVTCVVVILELTTTRLYAYVGSAHATATALSIALLGLALGPAVRTRAPHGLPLALLGLAAATAAGAPLVVLGAAALVTFALAGARIAAAYAARGAAMVRVTYAVDLGAAACGCLVAPRLIGPLAPTEIIAGAGLVACGLALLEAPRGRAGVALIAAAHLGLLVAGRLAALPDGPLAALLRTGPDGEKAMVDVGVTAADVVDSAWSPIGRLDVRRVPDDPTRLGVFTDGMSPTYMVAEGPARAGAVEATWGLLMALPYRALRPARVLVLGAGAGASVWLAKRYGAAQVDAVEANPALPDVLARWRAFAGDVYGEPGVRLITADARRYLADTDERYDLIELALALTGNAHAQPAGLESHLYTVEAVALYLRHLTPTGALVLVHSDPGNAYRQLLTVLAALAQQGVDRERALDGVAVLRDPRPGTAYRYLLVVRAAPMPLAIADALDAEPAELLWGPGDPPERRRALLDPRSLGATARDDLSPVHDDRPYFFQNTAGVWATALGEPGRLWVLAGALALVAALIVVARRGAGVSARAGLTAAGAGAAYLCVELALIQRLALAAGGTLAAISFVLCCVLAWSAVGALLLGRWWRPAARGVAWAALVAALTVGATAVALHAAAWPDAIGDPWARRAAIAALLAPAGLAIGGPFSTLLARSGAPERVTWLWAINGAAAVAGGAVAVLALRVGGTTHALALAAGLYAAVAVLSERERGAE